SLGATRRLIRSDRAAYSQQKDAVFAREHRMTLRRDRDEVAFVQFPRSALTRQPEVAAEYLQRRLWWTVVLRKLGLAAQRHHGLAEEGVVTTVDRCGRPTRG